MDKLKDTLDFFYKYFLFLTFFIWLLMSGIFLVESIINHIVSHTMAYYQFTVAFIVLFFLVICYFVLAIKHQKKKKKYTNFKSLFLAYFSLILANCSFFLIFSFIIVIALGCAISSTNTTILTMK